MQYWELEINKETTMCADKYKQTSSVNDIKGEENTSGIYEKKEKARDGYVCIYEWSKLLWTSTFEIVCTAQETTTRQIKEMLESFYYKRK